MRGVCASVAAEPQAQPGEALSLQLWRLGWSPVPPTLGVIVRTSHNTSRLCADLILSVSDLLLMDVIRQSTRSGPDSGISSRLIYKVSLEPCRPLVLSLCLSSLIFLA